LLRATGLVLPSKIFQRSMVPTYILLKAAKPLSVNGAGERRRRRTR